MPSPRPSAVVRLTAKTETSVMLPITYSSAKVPRMATSPMASGSRAATTLPKAMISRMRVTGTAMDSATARSLETWALTCSLSAAPPAGAHGDRAPLTAPLVGDVFDRLGVLLVDVGEDQRLGAVAGGEGRAARGPVGGDLGDALLGFEPLGQLGAGLLGSGCVELAALGADEQDEVVLAVEGVVYDGGRPRAGRVGVVEPAALELAEGAEADGGQPDRGEQGEQQYHAGPAMGEVGDASEHYVIPREIGCGWRARRTRLC